MGIGRFREVLVVGGIDHKAQILRLLSKGFPDGELGSGLADE